MSRIYFYQFGLLFLFVIYSTDIGYSYGLSIGEYFVLVYYYCVPRPNSFLNIFLKKGAIISSRKEYLSTIHSDLQKDIIVVHILHTIPSSSLHEPSLVLFVYCDVGSIDTYERDYIKSFNINV